MMLLVEQCNKLIIHWLDLPTVKYNYVIMWAEQKHTYVYAALLIKWFLLRVEKILTDSKNTTD